MSGRPAGGAQRVGAAGALGGAGLGVGEEGVVRAGVGGAVQVAAHGLDAGGDEDVALAGLDGVGGHADRLQRRRAVAVDGDAGDVGQPGQEGGHAGDVVAGLAAGLTAAEDDVLDLLRVELRGLLEEGLDDEPGQVVGAALGQAALVGTADRRAGGGDDDGFGHASPSSCDASKWRQSVGRRGSPPTGRRAASAGDPCAPMHAAVPQQPRPTPQPTSSWAVTGHGVP